MGLLLKEALKCLCAENRWSYAVFWKIGYRNPSLLIWEEYHYAPTRDSTLPGISGIESTESLLKEWEGLWGSPENRFPQLGSQMEDKVCLLINKMMKNNQVHVVGEGMVGRAAFSGNHQWILQENSKSEGYPSEVLAELHHQFSASMQTIAIIPVLPHGVIQLGSTLVILENMGFVNNVKSLFAQLGAVPGALLSDNFIEKDPDQKIGASTSLGRSVSSHPARNSYSQATGFNPFIGVNHSQEISTSQSSGQDIMQAISLQTIPGLSPSVFKSSSDLLQTKCFPVTKPNLPLKEQLENGAVILSNPDEWLNQWATAYDSSSTFNHQAFQSGSSCNGLSFMEREIRSGAGLQEPVNSSLPASNNPNASQLRSGGDTIPTYLKDSAPVSLITGTESLNTGNDHQMLTSTPSPRSFPCGSAESNSSGPSLVGLCFNSCHTSVVPISKHGNLSNNQQLLTGVPCQSHISANDSHTKCTTGQQNIENDLFQALNIMSVRPDEHISRCQPMANFLHGRWVSSPNHEKGSSRSQNLIREDAHLRPPSGDDLFDILGLDLKSEQFHGCWNDSLIHGADTNMKNVTADVSTCITQIDTGPNCYAVNDGISESGIFTETGSDHLLDAVVSKVHSGAKQNSDDDMSCWTTLRKISEPSVGTDSCTSGLVSAPDEKLGMFFSLPPPLAKAQVAGSSSFRSGCVKDNGGEFSQINSMYRSQISLLHEDGQNMQHDNSISTAHSMKPDKTGKSNRKRLRPGENPRPRPKDRQMIQDRVKELRDIVPNGAKCSIDALLERTIKHMLFLQSVTKHADKLKQTGESKIISKEGGSLLKDNFECGATWAFEVGSQSMVCPIIVEDLNPPRQMLVEMLCEERGFFLEIADIIRGLGLTILKGVMEARNDKVWVRFTVEANRDVTRMEIFLSLVHLLEQAVKSGTGTSKGTGSGNIIAHNTFHHASIPATGPSNSLQ